MKQHSIPEPKGRTTDDEGGAVERRLEANVAEIVIVVEVVIHGPVHLGEILLDLVRGDAGSPPTWGSRASASPA